MSDETYSEEREEIGPHRTERAIVNLLPTGWLLWFAAMMERGARKPGLDAEQVCQTFRYMLFARWEYRRRSRLWLVPYRGAG